MRYRTLAVLFVLGLVTVGVAAASVDKYWSVHADGSFEVPVRATDAKGFATFKLSRDELSLDFNLGVSNIENVFASHIHLAAPGVNGPIVAFLYGPVPPGGGPEKGLLSTGTITAASLVGPLAGQPLSALIAAMRAGNTYVNVHTNDGVAPPDTGPGDFPGGEIRGNIPSS